MPQNSQSNNQQQQIDQQSYQQLVNMVKPKPAVLKNSFNAFWVGGIICVIGQLILNFFTAQGLPKLEAGAAASATMVFIGAFLTGLGIYDEIGRFAGAGSIIPITGFANSIVSPAMEFKREGFVFGVAARMFNIAGPVIVYGTLLSMLIGLVYYLLQ